MSAPKVKSFNAVLLYWDSSSRAVARKQQAIAKSDSPQKACLRSNVIAVSVAACAG